MWIYLLFYYHQSVVWTFFFLNQWCGTVYCIVSLILCIVMAVTVMCTLTCSLWCFCLPVTSKNLGQPITAEYDKRLWLACSTAKYDNRLLFRAEYVMITWHVLGWLYSSLQSTGVHAQPMCAKLKDYLRSKKCPRHS